MEDPEVRRVTAAAISRCELIGRQKLLLAGQNVQNLLRRMTVEGYFVQYIIAKALVVERTAGDQGDTATLTAPTHHRATVP